MYDKKSMAKKRSSYKMKAAAYGNNPMKKNFPDLTGDGKVTQADILKGRGVSPMQKNPSYKKAFDAMKPTKSGTRVDKFGNVYKNSPEGLANFTKAAKEYNTKKKTPKKIEAKKVNKVELKKPELKKAITPKEVKKAKRKALISKIFGDGSKRKAYEANKKKRQNRSVTGRMKTKASKFGRMGT